MNEEHKNGREEEMEERKEEETETAQDGSAPGSGFRAGYVAIVGEPNVGKSTLMNTLVGMKLSIVTRKPQTTRKSVLGILTTDAAQTIFIDTPGVITPHYLLQEKLVGYVADAVRDADVILLMLDVTNPSIERLAKTPLGDVRNLNKPIILLLNKMDLLQNKRDALPLMERFLAMGIFREIIPASGLYAQNTAELVETIARHLPEGEPFYDPEMLSEQLTVFRERADSRAGAGAVPAGDPLFRGGARGGVQGASGAGKALYQRGNHSGTGFAERNSDRKERGVAETAGGTGAQEYRGVSGPGGLP